MKFTKYRTCIKKRGLKILLKCIKSVPTLISNNVLNIFFIFPTTGKFQSWTLLFTRISALRMTSLLFPRFITPYPGVIYIESIMNFYIIKKIQSKNFLKNLTRATKIGFF